MVRSTLVLAKPSASANSRQKAHIKDMAWKLTVLATVLMKALSQALMGTTITAFSNIATAPCMHAGGSGDARPVISRRGAASSFAVSSFLLLGGGNPAFAQVGSVPGVCVGAGYTYLNTYMLCYH